MEDVLNAQLSDYDVCVCVCFDDKSSWKRRMNKNKIWKKMSQTKMIEKRLNCKENNNLNIYHELLNLKLAKIHTLLTNCVLRVFIYKM